MGKKLITHWEAKRVKYGKGINQKLIQNMTYARLFYKRGDDAKLHQVT
jgi:hypothetical protein